jgi:uncharacterized protein
VNDYAGLLSAAERARLEARLAEGERATGVQMAVAIFRSLENESLEDFSIRLAEQWRIGRKELDDGAILLVFVEDRRVRLEIGYGLEPAVPDAVAGRIIREQIAPAFRENRYAAGLEAAAAALYARVQGKGAPEPARKHGPRPSAEVLGFVGLLAVIVLFLGWEAMTTRRSSGRRMYTLGRRGWSAPPARGWYGGGAWGAPRGGGGLGGGGGFSGGGGSFGGGGASGRW